jgi:hypothetical protein
VKSTSGEEVMEMVFIPDGRTKSMSTLSTKVDVAKIAGKAV